MYVCMYVYTIFFIDWQKVHPVSVWHVFRVYASPLCVGGNASWAAVKKKT